MPATETREPNIRYRWRCTCGAEGTTNHKTLGATGRAAKRHKCERVPPSGRSISVRKINIAGPAWGSSLAL